MQFSKLSSIAALSLFALTQASPLLEARYEIPACYKDAATAQATCINDVPSDANGYKDVDAVTACVTTATKAFKACYDSSHTAKRETVAAPTDVETCITAVSDVNTACIKAIPSDENGYKDWDAVKACSTAAGTSFRACFA